MWVYRSNVKGVRPLVLYLCFMVEDGEGELVYEGKRYDLKPGDVVFIDCRKAYSNSTGDIQAL